MSDLERCCKCDEPTGRAGKGDDSIYLDGGEGPFCLACYYPARCEELETIAADASSTATEAAKKCAHLELVAADRERHRSAAWTHCHAIEDAISAGLGLPRSVPGERMEPEDITAACVKLRASVASAREALTFAARRFSDIAAGLDGLTSPPSVQFSRDCAQHSERATLRAVSLLPPPTMEPKT